MDHARVAADVLTAVGGKENITAAAHCATRLRLVLNDYGAVDEDALNNDPDVKGIFTAGGMFQIIIGPGDVNTVYDHLINDHGVREVSKDEAKQVAAERENIFNRFIKMIADIFVPVLPALVAGGLMMALNNVLTAKGLIGDTSIVDMYPNMKDIADVINMVSSAAFGALPVLIGFSAAKRWGGNVYLGASIGAAMISGSLLNAWSMADEGAATKFWDYMGTSSQWDFFGYHVDKIGYQAQVIPTLVVVFVMCVIEKRFHKWFSGTLDFLLTPLLTLLITGFLAFTAIGPVTRLAADGITDGLQWVYNMLGPVGGFIFGLLYSPIVVTGLHQSFPAVEIPLINLLQTAPNAASSGDFIFPIASMANVAQGAACLAVFFKTRDAKIKGIAGASGLSAIFGITEPAIFGVNLRLRWPFFIAMGAAAIGGAGVALANVRASALGAAGFVGFVSIRTDNIPVYVALEVLTFILSFIAAWVYASTRGKASISGGGEAATTTAAQIDEAAQDDFTVTSPIEGTAIELSQVKDQTFASGMLGPGIAINPAGGSVVSPVDGEVIVAFPTGHAYGIRSASGIELLIHVGMDTVELDGKHFTPRVKVGDQVKRGDALVDVDWEAVKAAGYEIVTPMVVSNAATFSGVEDKAAGSIARGDIALVVEPAQETVAAAD